MQERPDFAEMLDCVGEFLQKEAAQKIADPHLRFRVRIAANLLAILQRELELEPVHLAAELQRLRGIFTGTGSEATPRSLADLQAAVAGLNARLAEEVRTAKRIVRPGDAVWEHARQTVIEQLRIANPAYLKRVGSGGGPAPS